MKYSRPYTAQKIRILLVNVNKPRSFFADSFPFIKETFHFLCRSVYGPAIYDTVKYTHEDLEH